LLLLASQADAAFTLRIQQLEGGTVVAEEFLTTGSPDDPTGILNYFGAVGEFTVAVSASGTESAGASLLQTIEIGINNHSTETNTLRVIAYASPFDQPVGEEGDPLTVVSTLASSFIGAPGSAEYVGRIDNESLDPLVINGFGAAATSIFHEREGSQFSLSSTLTLTMGGGGSGNATATTIAHAPAPASLTMLFSGLPMLGFVAYWFRRRGQPPVQPA
jgi:hypothetical protein